MLLNNEYNRLPDNDLRFTDAAGVVDSIVTSSGQNDSGLFETNLRDERYLPFEGAGAISEWRLQLPESFRQFDYKSISDIVLHVRYTARDGGKELADAAKLNILRQFSETKSNLVQMLSLHQEYPSSWNQLRSSEDGMTLIVLTKAHFPYLVSDKNIKVLRIEALANISNSVSNQTAGLGSFGLKFTRTDIVSNVMNLGFPDAPNFGNLRLNSSGGDIKEAPITISNTTGIAWKLELVADPKLGGVIDLQQRMLLEDIVLLIHYQIQK